MTLTSAPGRTAGTAAVRSRPPGVDRARRVRGWYGSWAGPWLLVPLGLGALLRLLATVTYWPGVDFLGDSYAYLANARHLRPDLWHPLVYPLFLRVVSWFGPVGLVAVVQSLLGLLAGVLVYRLARRLGAGDGAAALAAAPVLLDAWQLSLEQIVMSEALFEVLLTGALVLLLPRGPLSLRRTAAGGLLLSLAILTRTVALPVAALLGLLLVARRVGWRRLAVAAAAVALPVLGYAGAFAATYGPFALQGLSGRQVYGVAAGIARCNVLPQDRLSTTLCPKTPVEARAGNNQYTWDGSTPLTRVKLREKTADDRILEFNRNGARFAREVVTHQPLGYARYVADTTLRYFTVGRTARLGDYPQVAWQFLGVRSPGPVYDIRQDGADFRGGRPPSSTAPLPWSAGLLRAYQHLGYTPGPLLAGALVLGLLGIALRRGLRLELAVLTLGGLGVLLMPSLGAGFDYRYVLTALLLLPLAGVLGWAAVRQHPWAQRVLRTPHVRPLVVGALVMVLGSANVAKAGIVPVERQRVGARASALGQPMRLADGLTVTLGQPLRVVAKCRQLDYQSTWWWLAVVPVSVRTDGASHLVQTANVTAMTKEPWSLTGERAERNAVGLVRRGGDLEPPAIVSARHPRLDGLATVFTNRDIVELRYTDPSGGGTAAWPYAVNVRGLPAPDELCDDVGKVVKGTVVSPAPGGQGR